MDKAPSCPNTVMDSPCIISVTLTASPLINPLFADGEMNALPKESHLQWPQLTKDEGGM